MDVFHLLQVLEVLHIGGVGLPPLLEQLGLLARGWQVEGPTSVSAVVGCVSLLVSILVNLGDLQLVVATSGTVFVPAANSSHVYSKSKLLIISSKI